MAGLTAKRDFECTNGEFFHFPMAADAKIYHGALVCADTNGYAVPGADAAGLKFLGVAWCPSNGDGVVDNTGGANGDKWITVARTGIFEFDALSITQAMVGSAMYIVDDHTIGDASGPNNDIRVGILVKYVSDTKGWVDINK